MTREEAIRLLSGLMFKGKLKEALDMAIKALEQEPSGDLISRTEVRKFVEYIQSIKDNHNENQTPINYGTICDIVIGGWNLLKLPSVNPQEPKTGHWVKTPKAVMGEGYMWYCDKCEYQVYQDSSRDYPSEKYCPDCGHRMVEPQESEDKE